MLLFGLPFHGQRQGNIGSRILHAQHADARRVLGRRAATVIWGSERSGKVFAVFMGAVSV